MASEQPSRLGVLDTLLGLFDGRRGAWLTALLLPILLLLILWLPPISLGERVLNRGFARVSESGALFRTLDGSQLVLPADAVRGESRVSFTSTPRLEFIEGGSDGPLRGAAAALPTYLILRSPLYVAQLRGDSPAYSQWDLPIPADGEPLHLLDLYGWDGTAWRWLPHSIDSDTRRIRAEVAGLPLAMMVAQAQGVPATVGALSGDDVDFVNLAGSTLSYLAPRLYLMQGDGSIGQLFTPSPIFQQSGAPLLPVLHNIEPSGAVRSDLVDNLLIAPELVEAHIEQIERLVSGGGFEGIVLDYRGIDPALRGEYSSFVERLAARLALRSKRLVIRVDPATWQSDGTLFTGAYDWRVLGEAATTLQIPLPRGAEGARPERLDALVLEAVGQINRYKIEIELPVSPYVDEGGRIEPLPYADVISALRALAEEQGLSLGPGDPVEPVLFALSDAGRVALDPADGSYRLVVDGREVRFVGASSLEERLAWIERLHVAGVALVGSEQADPAVWELLAAFKQRTLVRAPATPALARSTQP